MLMLEGGLKRKKGGVVVAGPGEFAGTAIGQQDLAAFCPHRGRDHFRVGWVTTSEGDLGAAFTEGAERLAEAAVGD